MKIEKTKSFIKTCKKLTKEQGKALEEVIKRLAEDPLLGKLKTGSMIEVRVYKFSLINQLTLLAYRYIEEKLIITFLKIGPHQNFYRDLENDLRRK